jgi:tetratricopeptide (TPR) repeat protein
LFASKIPASWPGQRIVVAGFCNPENQLEFHQSDRTWKHLIRRYAVEFPPAKELGFVAIDLSNNKPVRQRRTRRFRFLSVVAIGLITAGVTAGVMWYHHDRPLQRIEAALASGDRASALKGVGDFLRQHPGDVRAQVLRARILVEAGQLTEALRVFHTTGASEMADLHAWAKAHLLRQEWSDALPVLDRVLQLSPDDPDALHEITACRSFLGHSREAFESARRLAQIPGHEARAWLQIGTLNENLGNDRSAIEAFEKVLQFEPEGRGLQVTPADFFGELGRVLLKDGNPQRAREMFERSLELSESAEIRGQLGQALQQLGDEDLAVQNWKRAVELGAKLREPREALAQYAFRLGRYPEARQWLEPILSPGTPPSSCTYLMQRICLAQGDKEAARHWQEQTESVRKREKLQSAINHTLIESPDSFWARAIRAYQFAEEGNWRQAEVMTQQLVGEAPQEPFVRELATCISRRGPLPSLDLLPVHQF